MTNIERIRIELNKLVLSCEYALNKQASRLMCVYVSKSRILQAPTCTVMSLKLEIEQLLLNMSKKVDQTGLS